MVHVYRFLSLNTIDVDILQARTGRILVEGPKGFDLLKESEIPDGVTKRFVGGASNLKLKEEDDN